MHRNTTLAVLVVLPFLVGCAHKAAVVAAPEPERVTLAPAPVASPDAIAEVQDALRDLTIRFEFDRDSLAPEAMHSLQKLAKVLRKHRAVTITIAGHADERGTEEYNFLLGQRRAESVRVYLGVLGVKDEQLETISFGAEVPAVDDESEEAFAANRRDELSVKETTASVAAAPGR